MVLGSQKTDQHLAGQDRMILSATTPNRENRNKNGHDAASAPTIDATFSPVSNQPSACPIARIVAGSTLAQQLHASCANADAKTTDIHHDHEHGQRRRPTGLEPAPTAATRAEFGGRPLNLEQIQAIRDRMSTTAV